MERVDVIVREATPADSAIIAKVIAMAIGDDYAVRDYCGEDYHAVLTEMALREDTQYSWRQSLVAEVGGVAVGAVVGYDGAQLQRLREGTFAVLYDRLGRVPNIVDETEAGEYYLDSVGVLAEYRGLGVGRALVSAFCRKAFSEGHERVGLIVDDENPDAEKLYTSLGFKRVGTLLFFGHNMWHLQRCADDAFTLRPIKERTPKLIEMLTTLWEASVRATHHFLSEEDILEIKGYVPEALSGVPHLVVAFDACQQPVAFMGIADEQIEMLFVAPMSRGRGVGTMLIEYGVANYNIYKVTVNEQNPAAVGFYEHIGFSCYRRSDVDEQGRPFPLLYMRLAENRNE